MRAKDKKDVYVLAPVKETVNGQTVVSEWALVRRYKLVANSAGSAEDIAMYGERIKEYIKICKDPSDGPVQIVEGDGICLNDPQETPSYIVESVNSARGFSTYTAKKDV